jgi:hypothetical protein
MAVFNAAARDRGIRVAEFQHGLVTRNHDAYNVTPRLAASPGYRATQPNTFLAYGRWWNDQFNAPVDERVVLGNPARTDALRSWAPAGERTKLLVLGDGIDTAASLELFASLKSQIPAPVRVVYRPHPLERPSELVASLEAGDVDRERDLYASFASTRLVVGEASTALYEAIGLVPEIYAWDTPKSRFYLGDHPFGMLDDSVGLTSESLTERPASGTRGVATDYWAEGWETALQSFVENACAS